MNIEAWGKVVDFLRGRKRAYQLTFGSGSPAAEMVLLDLAVFCRANETCFHPDPRIHAAGEGRREVWLRIQNHMNLSSEQLARLYAGKNTIGAPDA